MSTYGIKVTGADGSGSYLVADTNKDLVNYAVVATGTAQSVNLGSTQGRRPILLINGNDSANSGKIISTKFSGFSRSFYRYEYDQDIYVIDVETETQTTIDYVLLKDMTGISNATGSGDYGLRIKTAAGDVAVDSRKFLTDTRFLLKNVWAPGTRSGNQGIISTDPDEFVDSAWMVAFGSISGGEGMSIAGVLFTDSGTISNIKHWNFLEGLGDIGEGGSSGSSLYFSNFSTIMTGQKYT